MNLTQEILQAIVLGLVQGITEFLPISSTAHLLVVARAFGWTAVVGQRWFAAAIQFGSVLAILWYFRADLRQVWVGAWSAFRAKAWHQEEWKLLVGLAIGVLPTLMGGWLITEFFPENAFSGNLLIAITSIVMAGLLGLAERTGQRKRSFDSLTIRDGLWIGLGQMVALLPGASRSGSTLTAGLFLGLKRQTAAKFSFLLGLPTLTIATLHESQAVLIRPDTAVSLLVGIASAFVFSYGTIAWLLHYLQHHTNWIFIWYRLGLGIFLLLGMTMELF
ncbi:undecaprenyl-diphosphate phosphatase [Egbenema bharatensis]|uniref:undecaprenyl-diphosphate phosphatase n=1 Tax=Egbenema bharatensis TaxID=3463334 RepID=UPI003A835066